MKGVLQSWNKSLMARLVGTFVLLLLLTTAIVSYLVYAQATRSLTQSVIDRLQAVSVLKEDGLNRWVDQQRLDLVFIAWQPEVRAQASLLLDDSSTTSDRQSGHTVLVDYLQYVVTSIADTDELFILDLNGKVIVSTQLSHEGQSHAQDLFFTQGRMSTYVQPVYTSPETNRPIITVATPMFDQNNQQVGVLAGHLNLARIDRIILDRTGLGASGETYLVNPAHQFVSAALFTTPSLKDGSIRSFGIDAALNGKDGAALYTNYQGVPVIGYFNWLNNNGVALMAELSQAEAFAPARQLATNTAEFGLLSALLLAGIAYLLARRIARPILAITGTAKRVAGGDLTQTAPVMTEDEVGLLAQTFNEMIAQLRLLYEGLEKKVAERTADLVQVNTRMEQEIAERMHVQDRLHAQNVYLEALHETTLGLIGRLDLQELLEDLVRRAGLLMNTSHGFVYIAEPGADEIEGRVGIGLFNRSVGKSLKAGDGLVGTVWQTGQPMVINDYDHWSGRVKDFEYNQISSLAGVPLTSGTQVVGVLGLAYDCQDCETNKTFNQNEVDQLTRFAHLASLALDNARLYTAAKEARTAAEAADQAQSAFLANVSHELRTPLTSIRGFARIAQKRFQERILPVIPMDDPHLQHTVGQVNENLDIILAEGDRLTKLINDLLDLEKIRAGKMIWQMQPLQLGEIVSLAAAATAALFDSKGLTWQEQIPADLPLINGDRDRLEQVLINLISNSVKFSDAGIILCKATLQNGEVIISVKDHGIGIAVADQAVVFEKFKQVGDTLTNKPKGTGLGLPICKEIIEHHGGRMWLESEIGQGSTFYFSLPTLQAAPPRISEHISFTLSAVDTVSPAPHLPDPLSTEIVDIETLLSQLELRIAAAPLLRSDHQKTILLMDDDDYIRKLLRQELESEHYLIYEAETGLKALEQVKQVRPDLVLLDVMMPEMNGYDVAAVLKSDTATMNLPIVIISIVQDRRRGYQVGVDRYLTKPLDVPELLLTVQELLAQGTSHKKVLVVDEDTAVVKMLSEALLAQNYQVSSAYSGAEGLEKAISDQPDLIIANALLSNQNQLVQVLRFEKGLGQLVFLLFN